MLKDNFKALENCDGILVDANGGIIFNRNAFKSVEYLGKDSELRFIEGMRGNLLNMVYNGDSVLILRYNSIFKRDNNLNKYVVVTKKDNRCYLVDCIYEMLKSSIYECKSVKISSFIEYIKCALRWFLKLLDGITNSTDRYYLMQIISNYDSKIRMLKGSLGISLKTCGSSKLAKCLGIKQLFVTIDLDTLDVTMYNQLNLTSVSKRLNNTCYDYVYLINLEDLKMYCIKSDILARSEDKLVRLDIDGIDTLNGITTVRYKVVTGTSNVKLVLVCDGSEVRVDLDTLGMCDSEIIRIE